MAQRNSAYNSLEPFRKRARRRRFVRMLRWPLLLLLILLIGGSVLWFVATLLLGPGAHALRTVLLGTPQRWQARKLLGSFYGRTGIIVSTQSTDVPDPDPQQIQIYQVSTVNEEGYMYNQDTHSQKLLIIVSVLVIMLGGGLYALSLIRPNAQSAVVPAPAQMNQVPVRIPGPTPPPLPTISGPAAGLAAPTRTPHLDQDNSILQPGTTMPADASLAARVQMHLGCLRGTARHKSSLDEHAAVLAKEINQPLPQFGVVQLEEKAAQRFLIAPDARDALQLVHARCGETLIFGIPPLVWLPDGATFGIGADDRPEGVVVVVVIGS